jgi:small subunit ribosomal protein S1
LAQHIVAGLACSPLSGASLYHLAMPRWPLSALVCEMYVLTKDEQEREQMCQMFNEASNRCHTAPMEDVSFSPEDLNNADH